MGQIRNVWARGRLCEPKTGWAKSKQSGLAVLSMTWVSWHSPPSAAESGDDGSAGQESSHSMAPSSPLSAEFPVLPAGLSSPTQLLITSRLCLPTQGSLQGPGIRLLASQLLPPIWPPHCKTHDTRRTLDRNPAYQGVPGRWTLSFQCLENPSVYPITLILTILWQRWNFFQLHLTSGHSALSWTSREEAGLSLEIPKVSPQC